jgi:hypothetical protein
MPRCSYKHRRGLGNGIYCSCANGSGADDLLHVRRGRNSPKPDRSHRHQHNAGGSILPILHAWVSYFLDSKSPYKAWRMGVALVGTLETAELRDRVQPFVNWLQAACIKRGIGAGDRRFSRLDVDWAAIAPDARVIS